MAPPTHPLLPRQLRAFVVEPAELEVPLRPSGGECADGRRRCTFGTLGGTLKDLRDRGAGDLTIDHFKQVGIERLASGCGTRLEDAPRLPWHVAYLQWAAILAWYARRSQRG